MEQRSFQRALDILIRIKDNLLENMAEELLQHEHDDSSSFSLQEIEDRYAIRIANLNTLIITMQDKIGNVPSPSLRVATKVKEASPGQLERKLREMIDKIGPEEIIHLSIAPTPAGKYLIVLAHNYYGS